MTGLIRGRLTVGMVTGCTVTPLFEALAAFRRSHPGVAVTLVEESSDRLVDGVRSGALDLALVGTAEAAPTGLNALTIISERLVALVPPDHPLAEQTTVTLTDVAGHPVVCMPEGTGIRTVFDRACAASRARPEIAVQASAADAVADLAARGLGVAILTESMSAGYADRLKVLLITDADTPALLALVWSPTESPALARLVRYCRDAFGTGTQD